LWLQMIEKGATWASSVGEPETTVEAVGRR